MESNVVIYGVCGLILFLLVWFIRRAVRRDRSSRKGLPSPAGPPPNWSRFILRNENITLAIPSDWLTRERIEGPISRGNSFVALSPDGLMIFEVFLFKSNSVEFYAKMWEDDAKKNHPGAKIVESVCIRADIPYDSGIKKERWKLSLIYEERTTSGKTEAFTTDYYILDTEDIGVISLNFKVVSWKYGVAKTAFESVANSVILADRYANQLNDEFHTRCPDCGTTRSAFARVCHVCGYDSLPPMLR